jgi:ABC-type glycerol-3-phosphate transport system substrate-binding protein
VNKASEHIPETVKSAGWMTLGEGSSILGKRGLPIPTRSVLLNEENLKGSPHWKNMYEYVAKWGKGLPIMVSYPMMEEAMLDAISTTLAGEKDAKTALDEAAKRTEEAMKLAGEL